MQPTCAKCNDAIEGKVIKALDKTWHPNHFCCDHCFKPIDSEPFKLKDGKPYCVEDYLKFYAPKCTSCSKPIEGLVRIAKEKPYHEECFVCEACKKQIQNKSFIIKNDKYYCVTCQ